MTTPSASCPVCGRPVDPLRARAVGVKDGKVVAYDRAECKAKAEGVAVVVEDKALDVRVTLRTPSKGMPAVTVPAGQGAVVEPASDGAGSGGSRAAAERERWLDSGPIIEVVREASVPTRDPTPIPTRGDATPATKQADVASTADDSAASKPDAKRPRSKRLDTDTRHLQPPPDYDDSDLGPPSEAEPARRPPYLMIIIVVALTAAAVAVAFSMN